MTEIVCFVANATKQTSIERTASLSPPKLILFVHQGEFMSAIRSIAMLDSDVFVRIRAMSWSNIRPENALPVCQVSGIESSESALSSELNTSIAKQLAKRDNVHNLP